MKSDKIYSMRIIAIVESDDCGPAVILDSDCISIAKCSDFYIAASRCVYTHRPITCEISEETAKHLMEKGVKCIDINEEFFDNSKEKGSKSID
jgi:hypothetical protein